MRGATESALTVLIKGGAHVFPRLFCFAEPLLDLEIGTFCFPFDMDRHALLVCELMRQIPCFAYRTFDT